MMSWLRWLIGWTFVLGMVGGVSADGPKAESKTLEFAGGAGPIKRIWAGRREMVRSRRSS